MLFFSEMNGKTLSLKNLIGPEALHQDPRPKPKPTPSRPDGSRGACVESLPLSLSRLHPYVMGTYINYSQKLLFPDMGQA